MTGITDTTDTDAGMGSVSPRDTTDQMRFGTPIMSLSRKTLCFVAMLAVLGSVSSRLRAEGNTFYDPFCADEIDLFDPIYCDCADYGGGNVGWFFAYDRMRMNGTRPDEAAATLTVAGLAVPPQQIPNPPQFPQVGEGRLSADQSNDYEGDWTWGNRFDIGYMHENGDGIWFVARKLNNPIVQLFEDNVNFDGQQEQDLLEGPLGPTFITFNSFNYYDFEINRVWRLPPTARGVVFEPFTGPRYVRIRDHFDRADFFRDEPGVPTVGPANGTLTVTQGALYRNQEVTTDNDLYGGQLGLRSHWRRGRWVFSNDIRGFVFQNFRGRSKLFRDEFTRQDLTGTYDANGALQNIVTAELDPISAQTTRTDESGRFVWGGELRLETMFEVTKGFALRGAADILVFADGIGRGAFRTDDNFALTGFTFGVAFNR